ncbi:unnamed protein product, partial [Rotaria sp. Silwood2]
STYTFCNTNEEIEYYFSSLEASTLIADHEAGLNISKQPVS